VVSREHRPVLRPRANVDILSAIGRSDPSRWRSVWRSAYELGRYEARKALSACPVRTGRARGLAVSCALVRS
jgi:hypothetical protein